MPFLTNWSVVSIHRSQQNSGFSPPELSTPLPAITGIVAGHPSFNDGDKITTSTISNVIGEVVVTVSGSRYTLGDPDPNYELLFPKAKIRLANRLALM